MWPGKRKRTLTVFRVMSKKWIGWSTKQKKALTNGIKIQEVEKYIKKFCDKNLKQIHSNGYNI